MTGCVERLVQVIAFTRTIADTVVNGLVIERVVVAWASLIRVVLQLRLGRIVINIAVSAATSVITSAVVTKITCVANANTLIPSAAPAAITVVREVSTVVVCAIVVATMTAVAVVGHTAVHGTARIGHDHAIMAAVEAVHTFRNGRILSIVTREYFFPRNITQAGPVGSRFCQRTWIRSRRVCTVRAT